MHYQEYIPIKQLQPYIKCIWTLQSAELQKDRAFDRIFPDGCAELIFHFGVPFERKIGDDIYTQEHFFLCGQLTRFLELRPSEWPAVMGIRFHPYGVAAFTSVAQHKLNDKEIVPSALFAHTNGLFAQLAELTNDEERITVVNDFLLANLSIQKKKNDAAEFQSVLTAVQLMKTSQSPTVVEIADKLHISSREMERRFKQYVGLSPKQLAKTLRFQEVLQLKSKSCTLTEAAHLSGYYDQSHFIRDFRYFSGWQPKDFFKEEAGLPDFFVSARE